MNKLEEKIRLALSRRKALRSKSTIEQALESSRASPRERETLELALRLIDGVDQAQSLTELKSYLPVVRRLEKLSEQSS